MCGRFTLHADLGNLDEHFGVGAFSETRIPPRFNIAPSQDVAVVRRAASGRREVAWCRWGLVPYWAKEEKLRYSTINARAETVATTPTYRGPFRQRRCLVVADGFYEWQQPTGKGRRQPWYVRLREGGLMAFAGLWDRWHRKDGTLVESCTVIVTDANELLCPIHDRMPVILAAEDYDTWLDVSHFDRQRLEALLRPYPPELLETYRVSTTVNSPGNDDPRCIDPFDTGA